VTNPDLNDVIAATEEVLALLRAVAESIPVDDVAPESWDHLLRDVADTEQFPDNFTC
jgi:hypothetical protein